LKEKVLKAFTVGGTGSKIASLSAGKKESHDRAAPRKTLLYYALNPEKIGENVSKTL